MIKILKEDKETFEEVILDFLEWDKKIISEETEDKWKWKVRDYLKERIAKEKENTCCSEPNLDYDSYREITSCRNCGWSDDFQDDTNKENNK